MQRMTRAAARRTAIAATGLDRPRPEKVTARHLKNVFDTLGLTQIDSVARVVRSTTCPTSLAWAPIRGDLDASSTLAANGR